MSRHDFGFDAFADSVDDLEQAVRDAASRVSHGSHPWAAELVDGVASKVTQLAAELRHEGPMSVHVEGHLNEAHPGDGTQPDELLVAVRCAHPLPPVPTSSAADPADASPVDEAQPSQAAMVGIAGDRARDATPGEAPVGA